MKKLLDKMTTIEKLGQLVQLPPFLYIETLKDEVYGPAVELGLTRENVFNTGTVLGVSGPEEMIEIQSKYLANNRLGIPLLFMADIIHGYETIFPIPLAQASSFNRDLVRRVAEVSALEASLSGIGVTFSPMADISRDPRWGRVMESFGEDPYLNYAMSYEMVKGYQGKNIKDYGKLASCFKHFAGYALSEAGRDYNTVDLSEYALKQYFLQGYKGAIDAGAKMAMTSFNIFEGVPATINEKLINKILRKDLGFNGVVISDYNSVKETIIHGISKDNKDAALKAIKAGLDIEMPTATYMTELEKAFNKNEINQNLLDEKVLRVLNLKKELGLFENPYKDVNKEMHEEIVKSKEHLDFSYQTALESIVLLKNNQILPIKNKEKVALLGPNINEKNLNGAWSWHGSRDNETLFEALSKRVKVVSLDQAETVIYFGGEKYNESGEAKSKTNIDFTIEQLNDIKELKNQDKKVILVIQAGRPLVLSNVIEEVEAIMYVWFLGTKGALAIADTILGLNNPSGKVAMSFPRSVGQIPIYYNHLPTGRPKNNYDNEYTSNYLDCKNSPLFEFGYGLSYSDFSFSNLRATSIEILPDQETLIQVDVTNNSNTAGYEVVQLYINDMIASVSRPLKELKDFKKIWLNGHETKTVTFKITDQMFEYYNQNLDKVKDFGEFKIYVGNSSATNEYIKIKYKSGDVNG